MRYEILQDSNPMNPREEWDNLCTMSCQHRRYTLGDKDGWEEFWETDKEEIFWLPLFLYDHSGLTISTKRFSCPFDTSDIGYIWVSRETVRKEFGKQRISKKLEEQVYNLMRSEVETYDSFLRGDVWDYRVLDDEGEVLDSCWGYFDRDDCEHEAKAMLAHYDIQLKLDL